MTVLAQYKKGEMGDKALIEGLQDGSEQSGKAVNEL